MKSMLSVVAALGLAAGTAALAQNTAPAGGGSTPPSAPARGAATTPPARTPAAPRTRARLRAAGETIVTVAQANGNFKTLCELLAAADLVETLNGKGPFTVFAPTDAAFAKLPKETLDSLRKDKAKLKEILTYHVVNGKVMAADVVKLKETKTVNGAPITISVKEGKVWLNGASSVTTADVAAGNGVIHVVDTVIMPSAKHSAPAAPAKSGSTTAPAGGKSH